MHRKFIMVQLDEDLDESLKRQMVTLKKQLKTLLIF